MDKSPIFLVVKLLVLGFCAFMGGYVANLGPHRAEAQRTLPRGGSGRIQPTVTDTIVVPPNGLKFVTSGGEVVAALGTRGNESILALFDGRGQPAVTLTAGSGGFVEVSTNTGGQVRISSNNRSNKVALDASNDGTKLELARGDTNAVTIKDDLANGSRLTLADRGGHPGLDAFFSNSKATLALLDSNGDQLATLASSGTAGTIELKDPKRKSSSLVSGEGKVTLSADEKKWVAPPADGGG